VKVGQRQVNVYPKANLRYGASADDVFCGQGAKETLRTRDIIILGGRYVKLIPGFQEKSMQDRRKWNPVERSHTDEGGSQATRPCPGLCDYFGPPPSGSGDKASLSALALSVKSPSPSCHTLVSEPGSGRGTVPSNSYASSEW